ncbi:class IV adenylate cyclase [Candidatus Pacearchaeota archaeon]|jgi:adenylate cyclase class 2|nr:class IV adenylate cyclase [Candidatus Pacearchaeota archaeon]|tara:strand:- start:5319 stop:5900 length:582 start_codon:yes stop_codon:yes gene_type:complete
MVLLEVETKVKINDVNSLRKRIREIANLKKIENRSDDYFALNEKFRKQGYPKKAFRIRNNGKEYVINFKKWKKDFWTKEIVVKEEFEFKIKKIENFLALIEDLGFVEWMKKIKTSESYIHKKDKRIVIEINKVKHLGYFMEIEYIVKPIEIKKAKKKIYDVLKELNIEKKDIDNTGYTKMLWNKGIKDKKHWI